MNAVLDCSELDFTARVSGKRTLLADAFTKHSTGPLGPVTVGDVMTVRPSCVTPETTAMELVHLFQERRFRHLLVVDNEKLVGVVSDRDVIRLLSSSDGDQCGRTAMEQLTAGELMSNGAVTVTANCPLVKAVRILVERNIHCLPVTDGERPIGILTGTDLFLSLEQLLTMLPTANDVRA